MIQKQPPRRIPVRANRSAQQGLKRWAEGTCGATKPHPQAGTRRGLQRKLTAICSITNLLNHKDGREDAIVTDLLGLHSYRFRRSERRSRGIVGIFTAVTLRLTSPPARVCDGGRQ